MLVACRDEAADLDGDGDLTEQDRALYKLIRAELNLMLREKQASGPEFACSPSACVRGLPACVRGLPAFPALTLSPPSFSLLRPPPRSFPVTEAERPNVHRAHEHRIT